MFLSSTSCNRGSCSVRRAFSQGFSACGKKLESPRTPLVLPDFIKSTSPLIDPASPFSLPDSDADRLRWLTRFTPRWNETPTERDKRLKKRAKDMRTRRGHTERILNSFQRLDAYTSTILPSDLMICLSYSRFPSQQTTDLGSRLQIKQNQNSIYLTPNRILHPFWTPRKEGISTWIFCHRDSILNPKKLRSVYRNVREPKFSKYLADQISSQLVRRIAQECVVLRDTLLKTPLTPKRSSLSVEVGDHPVFITTDDLLELISSFQCKVPNPRELKHRTHSSTIGGIAVFSSRIFSEIASGCDPDIMITTKDSPRPDSGIRNNLSTPQTPNLMFSILSSSGPLPVWDIEGLLREMSKEPPKGTGSTSLTTAAIQESTILTALDQLPDILKDQILTALWKATSLSNNKTSIPPKEQPVCLLPLTETSYPLLLSLRRATWWLGQGYEPAHLSSIDKMVEEAEVRMSAKDQAWNTWLARRATVQGEVRNGRLLIDRSKQASHFGRKSV